MEGLLFKTLSENIQDEAISRSQGPEDVLESEPTLSSTPVDNEKLELNKNEETNWGVNGNVDVGSESFGDCEHSSDSALLQQKTYSPTLIESAFKVMKNLFSPDKTKGKATNKISPGKQHQSSSGSPSSICIPSKAEFGILETGIESPLTIQAGENSMKSQLSMNQVGVLFSPLPLESHNNTDESFLTTVSIIDDSFHSAITNLDENGEIMKLETNVMESFLNNTQNSDVGDPYNDTLEVTTLRNGSFASDGTKVENASVVSKEGSGECSLVNRCNGSLLDDCGKDAVKENQIETPKKDSCDGEPQRSEEQPLGNGHSEHNTVSTEGDSSTAFAQADPNDLNNSMRNVKMENLFLNKSFDTSKSVSGSPKGCPQPASADENDAGAGEVKTLQLDGWDRPTKEAEVYFEGSKDERDICLDSSISTTTFVLKSVDSSDLEIALMALKENNSEADTISSTCSITPIASCENQLSKELDNFLNIDPASRNIAIAETNSTLVHKPQKNRSSISDKGTPGIARNVNKIKLHKSDELLNHRVSGESSEGKRIGHKKKSSLDVPLIKNIEATKNLHPETSSNCTADFGASELNVHAKEALQNPEKGAVPKSPAAVSVISQQSYTVLNADDKKLNRPVIEPLNVEKDLPQKVAFQTTDLSTNCSAETRDAESCSSGSYCNSSLNAGGSGTPSQQKQSTPLLKGSARRPSGESCQTVVKSISLDLSSRKESAREGKGNDFLSASSKSEVLEKTIQMPNSNEDPAEFSPVNPICENELMFSNSVESEGNQSLNGTRVLCSNDPNEPIRALKGVTAKRSEAEVVGGCQLNQTFDKKQVCPVRSVLTSEGALGCEKLNVTYDKSTGLPLANVSNEIFIKEMESFEIERINQTFYVSESAECVEMNKTFNKASAKKSSAEKGGTSGPQKLNERFGKRSQSPLAGKSDQTFDTRSGSPGPSTSNQTFVKEKTDGRKKAQEINKTFEVAPVPEGVEGKNLEGEAQAEVEEAPSGSQSKEGKAPSKDSPAEHSCDQQVAECADGCHRDMNGSFVSGRSSNTSLVGSELSTFLLSEGSLSRNQSLEDLAGKLSKLNLNESIDGKSVANGPSPAPLSEVSSVVPYADEQIELIEAASEDKLKCDPYLVQLIQEQFSSNDIEKICSVVDDFSAIKLSSQILRASEQFDKSFHESQSNAETKPEAEEKPEKLVNPLSPKSFDFLSSIQGKPTGRDWSRESLYVKFDPLVQPNPNSLIDFTKEGEALTPGERSPLIPQDSSVCEQLLTISPQKKPDDIVPPLTPLSHKSKAGRSEDKTERIKELQNEIYFLKNLYAERERANKAKVEEYESQVAKLTGESCFLEDRLKESGEREKALVRKMKEQNQGLGQLKIIMEEYVKVISKLTAELEALKTENQQQVEALATEKDSYETHLQNTEAAFTDVHAKYEKSKKTIVSLKANEAMYRSTIAEQAAKMEELKLRAREAQEKALREFQKVQEELGESKASHGQETARLRAQLRKTELKVEALQESLEQKVKENQQLTAICDELIEGKK